MAKAGSKLGRCSGATDRNAAGSSAGFSSLDVTWTRRSWPDHIVGHTGGRGGLGSRKQCKW